jgi:Uma2 family endonuclease
MSTITTTERVAARDRIEGERRWVIRDASWDDYKELAERLPSSFRLAFDGRDLEIMVTGMRHELFGWLMVELANAVLGHLEVRFFPAGRATWQRPEINRGIEADACYILDPDKLETARAANARKSNDVADYPNPDLAIEVDISRPQVDRQGIYAALGVSELWRVDGDTPVIERLGPDGRYVASDSSGWLPVRLSHLRRWLVEEDSSDPGEWSRRMHSWVKRTYKKKRGRQ